MNTFDFNKPISVTLINIKGEYVVYNRKFVNDRHFNNWIDLMERYNYKQIGIQQ